MLETLIGLINPAMAILGAFTGSAQEAKISGTVQNAVGVVNALTPLVTQFTSGKEVTEADVRDALAGMDGALKNLDDLIAAKGG